MEQHRLIPPRDFGSVERDSRVPKNVLGGYVVPGDFRDADTRGRIHHPAFGRRGFYLAHGFRCERLRGHLKSRTLEEYRDDSLSKKGDGIVAGEQRSDRLYNCANDEISGSAAFLGGDGIVVLETDEQHGETGIDRLSRYLELPVYVVDELRSAENARRSSEKGVDIELSGNPGRCEVVWGCQFFLGRALTRGKDWVK